MLAEVDCPESSRKATVGRMIRRLYSNDGFRGDAVTYVHVLQNLYAHKILRHSLLRDATTVLETDERLIHNFFS
jgi:hypothetical protein